VCVCVFMVMKKHVTQCRSEAHRCVSNSLLHNNGAHTAQRISGFGHTDKCWEHELIVGFGLRGIRKQSYINVLNIFQPLSFDA